MSVCRNYNNFTMLQDYCNSGRDFFYPIRDNVNDMKDKNKVVTIESPDKIMEKGYQPCGRSKP